MASSRTTWAVKKFFQVHEHAVVLESPGHPLSVFIRTDFDFPGQGSDLFVAQAGQTVSGHQGGYFTRQVQGQEGDASFSGPGEQGGNRLPGCPD